MRWYPWWLLSVMLHIPPELVGAEATLPTNSLYHLDVSGTDEDGKSVRWSELRGKVVVAVLVYSHCTSACPLLLGDIKRLAHQLSGEQESEVHFVLVSLDPIRDTPQRLKQLESNLTTHPSTWHLLRTSDEDLRLLATALDVKFHRNPDGVVNHTAVITLLDRDGTPRARVEGLSQPQDTLLREIQILTPPKN